MPEVLEGELTRHHNQAFYSQKQAPQFFWGGCLIPVIIIASLGFFIFRGISAVSNFEVVRIFVLVVILFTFGQLIFGGALFAKTHSSLSKGLLIGGIMLILLMVLALIGLFSTLGGFLQ